MAILIGALMPDFTNLSVMACTSGSYWELIKAPEPWMYHRGWPGSGPTHSLVAGSSLRRPCTSSPGAAVGHRRSHRLLVARPDAYRRLRRRHDVLPVHDPALQHRHVEQLVAAGPSLRGCCQGAPTPARWHGRGLALVLMLLLAATSSLRSTSTPTSSRPIRSGGCSSTSSGCPIMCDGRSFAPMSCTMGRRGSSDGSCARRRSTRSGAPRRWTCPGRDRAGAEAPPRFQVASTWGGFAVATIVGIVGTALTAYVAWRLMSRLPERHRSVVPAGGSVECARPVELDGRNGRRGAGPGWSGDRVDGQHDEMKSQVLGGPCRFTGCHRAPSLFGGAQRPDRQVPLMTDPTTATPDSPPIDSELAAQFRMTPLPPPPPSSPAISPDAAAHVPVQMTQPASASPISPWRLPLPISRRRHRLLHSPARLRLRWCSPRLRLRRRLRLRSLPPRRRPSPASRRAPRRARAGRCSPCSLPSPPLWRSSVSSPSSWPAQ